MTMLDADPREEALFYADLAERVARRKRLEREANVWLGLFLFFVFTAVIGAARGVADAIICYKVGCP